MRHAVAIPPTPPLAPPAPALQPPEEEHPIHPVNFWQHPWVQNLLPFGTSLAIHAAIIVVALATYQAITMISNGGGAKEQIVIPDATLVVGADVGGIPNPGMGSDPNRKVSQADDPSVTDTTSDVSRAHIANPISDLAGGTDVDSSIVLDHGPLNPGQNTLEGLAGGATGSLPQFGIPGGGGGRGPRSILFGHSGNAMRIVYICDASGSMIEKMDLLKRDLENGLENLSPIQSFDIVFFQDTVGNPDGYNPLARSALMATVQNQRKAFAYLDTIAPSGRTYVIPALKFAFHMDPKPDLIYLLTDGAFEDEGGDAVRAAIDNLDSDHRVKVNTVLFISEEDESPDNADDLRSAEEPMRAIANDTGGTFQQHSMDELLGQSQ
ncbi:MAG TPA: hypothetical protein VMD30_03390 [Tepidisphaeraceae bacterium]|nr:hypothetical protein [Tepidisphaeraceae bacterium]